MEADYLMDIGKVAHYLDLHPNTVRRWEKKGTLKSYIINERGDRRFRKSDIDKFLAGCKHSERND